MRVRTRLLVAAAFAVLFVLLPSPDAQHGRPYLARLLVREWLLGDDSPLRSEGPVPRLTVDVLHSPPIEDAAEAARVSADYARIADELALARRHDREPAPAAERPPALLSVRVGEFGVQAELQRPDRPPTTIVRALPGRSGLLPAVIAIVLAVLTQRVLLGLLCGGLAGAIAWAATHQPGVAVGLVDATIDGTRHFFASALWQRSVCEDFYLRITAFVVFLFMTIGVITHNGGVLGLVQRLQRVVRGPTSAQGASFLAGLCVFFDDYTNCMLVGSTMRPLTDRARVAREKLAYIVDSTAAPIAGLSVFSTWVVYEMSQYRGPLTLVTRADGRPYTENDAFEVFLASLPFRFYSVFALCLVALVIFLRRDFGPMLAAERRARLQGLPLPPGAAPMAAVDERAVTPDDRTPRRARNALLPLVVLVGGTVALMLLQGVAALGELPADRRPVDPGAWLREVLANAQSDKALFWASVAAWCCALLLTFAQRLLTVRQALLTSLRATKALGVAFGILFLAWSLGHVCHDLGTSFFLTAAVRDAMTVTALPLVLFAVAGGMSFATGTSFGTMAILLPNVVVLAHQLGTDSGFGGTALMLVSIGAVLEGAIFGDHCSPISDTTVLSSLGSQCHLLGHVGTQLPYALLAMGCAAGGYLTVLLLGPGWWPAALLGGVLVMAAVLLKAGQDPARAPTAPSA
ncbi:MAG: Na+/H+ antiporter NhaC family protein [Planctomycetota bacterium]